MSELLRNPLVMYPRAFFRLTIVILNNILCIPTYVVWMTLLLPVKRYSPDLYYKIEGRFFHWILALVAMWSWSAGYSIVELGDDITPCRKKDTKTLIIANHQSTADVPLMMQCFNAKPDILPNIMWIMERLFKYTNFGIVSLIHQDFFISSGRSVRDQSIKLLKQHLEESFIPRMRKFLVLFPEGGFLHKRKEISKRFAEKNNLPDLNNVSLPRVGALKAILSVLPFRSATDTAEEETAIGCSTNNNSTKPIENGNIQDVINEDKDPPPSHGQYLDYVLDITIAYPEGKPLDLPNIVHGLRFPCPTYFYYRLYHTSQIPKDDEALTSWLFDRWTEKEKILEEFYKTGSFSNFANAPVAVQQDMLRFLIINLFFITSSYVHLQMFYMLMDYCNTLYLYSFM